jgi:hypothetical protein
MNTAQQDCMARLHVHDIGAQITYLGLIDDLQKVKLFEADTLTIDRKGPLLEVSFWGEMHGAPAVVRSHAEPWDKVLTLPTAAAAPVVNPSRRGRLPRCVAPLARGRELRAARQKREAEQSGRLKIGDYVMIWQSHSTNSNNGRIGQLVAECDYETPGELAWKVYAVGPRFDVGGNPANGGAAAAIFKDAWLLPMSPDAAKVYENRIAGR